MAPVIVGKDLYKCYPGFPPVLRGVNIEVEPGEMVAIMGPSGCGKSTMLHILGMLHAPDSGSLDILGQNVLAMNSEQTAAFRRGNMGFVMQASNLFEHSTVFENVEFPLIYENVPPQERWGRVIRALELVRLSGRVHYRSNRLSGGEQQRVAIARAMVNNPRILLADEPTGALDAHTSRVIMENFQRLCHTGGVAMVMVTHDPKMAEYCDSIYTLEDGILKCKKHEPPKLSVSANKNFLEPPEPLVRAALIAWRFPGKRNYNVLELARLMHEQRLLACIYALAKSSLLGNDAGYSLPLPVRRMGFWQRILGLGLFLHHARASFSFWRLWRLLPKKAGVGNLRGRLRAFGAGAVLARWAMADNGQFLYATGARKESFAAWAASKILNLPFAFAVRSEDIPRLGPDCEFRAKDAAFVTCSTEAIRQAFLKLAPEAPDEKVLLLPEPPIFTGVSDEPPIPPPPGKPLEILASLGDKATYNQLLKAAKDLRKKGVAFRLIIIGPKVMSWRIFWSGLRKQISFTGKGLADGLAEAFRNADIFVISPSKFPGADLAMPWQLCEAMASGLAILTTGITPGMAPLKNKQNCLEAGQEQDFLADLLKLASDKELAGRLGDAARKDLRANLNLEAATRILADRIIMATGQASNQANDSNGL